MSAPLILYGAGGLGRELLAVARRCGRTVMGFVDDSATPGSVVNDVSVLGNGEWLLENQPNADILLSIGDPTVKESIVRRLAGYSAITFAAALVDPAAQLLDPARIRLGKGTVITAGCVLTTGIVAADHVLINLNTSVGHDAVIGNCSSIMPGCRISGAVTLGSAVLIGTGATVLNNISIGNGSMVGAGSVVNHDVSPNKKVIGVPARELNL